MLLTFRDTAACPPSPREGGRSEVNRPQPGPVRGWQHPNAAMAALATSGRSSSPAHPRSLLSVRCSQEVQLHLLCYSPSSSSSWSPSASSLPAKPAQLPLQALCPQPTTHSLAPVFPCPSQPRSPKQGPGSRHDLPSTEQRG